MPAEPTLIRERLSDVDVDVDLIGMRREWIEPTTANRLDVRARVPANQYTGDIAEDAWVSDPGSLRCSERQKIRVVVAARLRELHERKA
jgi:hypothetical protein